MTCYTWTDGRELGLQMDMGGGESKTHSTEGPVSADFCYFLSICVQLRPKQPDKASSQLIRDLSCSIVDNGGEKTAETHPSMK